MFPAGDIPVNEATVFVSTIGQSLTRLIFPPTCCLCGFASPDLDLCDVCARLLPRSAAGAVPPVFARALVPFEYGYPVDRFIRALKFRGERVYARVLGGLLADAHLRTGEPLPQLLIPVPLHPQRYRHRGFNQAAEIARFAATRLALPLDTTSLIRTIATQEQSGLTPSERRRNVRRAFHLQRPLPVTHVALVDDVVTTGSTAAEAARALSSAAPIQIDLWALARAPDPLTWAP